MPRIAAAYHKTMGRIREGDIVRVTAEDSEAYQHVGRVSGYDMGNMDHPLKVEFSNSIISLGDGKYATEDNFGVGDLEVMSRGYKRVGRQERRFSRILNNPLDEVTAKSKVENRGVTRYTAYGEVLCLEIDGKEHHFRPGRSFKGDAKSLHSKFEKISRFSQGRALKWLRNNAECVSEVLDPSHVKKAGKMADRTIQKGFDRSIETVLKHV